MRIKANDGQEKRGDGGFMMIEVMVGMLVVGIVFVALYAGISSGFSVIQVAEENARAIQILEEKLETVRLYTWTQLNTANFIPNNFTVAYSTNSGLVYNGKMQIKNAWLTESYNSNLKEVHVEVKWMSGAVERKREMTTLVSQHGIQNYIY